MLRTTKNMKEKYEQIQNYLSALIPEKWDEIHLYASVPIEDKNSKTSNSKNAQFGEMFFYYLPKGLLRKKPINVYEVPQRFNINEEQYLKIVEELYKNIKDLKQDFIDTEQELWTNLTISIANCKFKIEYNYDELPVTDKEIFARNVIWKYKYLKIGGESKEERRILEEYFSNSKPAKKEIYETGFYIKTENNIIEFGKEDVVDREFIMYEKDGLSIIGNSIKNKFRNSVGLNKVEPQEKSNIEKYDEEESENKKTRNQILDN